MNMRLKLPLCAFMLAASISAQADDSAIIGAECATSNDCVTEALHDFYAQALPMNLAPAITLTDFTVREDISVASVLLAQSRSELVEEPSDERALTQTLDQYAEQMTCGVKKSLEQYYLKTGGQIIWKYYFADGEYLDSRAFVQCN